MGIARCEQCIFLRCRAGAIGRVLELKENGGGSVNGVKSRRLAIKIENCALRGGTPDKKKEIAFAQLLGYPPLK